MISTVVWCTLTPRARRRPTRADASVLEVVGEGSVFQDHAVAQWALTTQSEDDNTTGHRAEKKRERTRGKLSTGRASSMVWSFVRLRPEA